MAPMGAGIVDNLVRRLDLRGRRVLDIGCGSAGPPSCWRTNTARTYGLRGGAEVVDVPGEIRTGDRIKLEVPR